MGNAVQSRPCPSQTSILHNRDLTDSKSLNYNVPRIVTLVTTQGLVFLPMSCDLRYSHMCDLAICGTGNGVKQLETIHEEKPALNKQGICHVEADYSMTAFIVLLHCPREVS